SVLKKRAKDICPDITNAIGQSVAYTASNLDVPAIVTVTESGFTARAISKYRPKAPIVAVTPDERTHRQLSLSWGVHSILSDRVNVTDELIGQSVAAAEKAGFVAKGDAIVLTAGLPLGTVGSTNMMKVQVVGEGLFK
ncbi:MAG: pyruvate kinase alpha/beta domain-containing protein, partial [Mycoplasmatales bacterium]